MRPPVLGRTRSLPGWLRTQPRLADRLLDALAAGAGAPTRVTPKTAATANGRCRRALNPARIQAKPGRAPPIGALLRGSRPASTPRTDLLDPCGVSAESLERHDFCVYL